MTQQPPTTADPLGTITALAAELNRTFDVDHLLDRILHLARDLARAEAGSIFLLHGERLRFCYVQNDGLYPDREPARQYVGEWLELDSQSLAGHAGLTGEVLNIPDVYRLDAAAPYHFNQSFDLATGYRTRSVLVIPMAASPGETMGVLEVINARDHEGRVVPFTNEQSALMQLFAHHAAMAVEQAQYTRRLILRMISIAELRDPMETGPHVNRVGGYAAEIYQAWASGRGLDDLTIQRKKDLIRVAAMLHDVGKVAVSDVILRKPGRLEPDEFQDMQYHTVAGARLLYNPRSELDRLALDIVLRHHERFDGGGYPGRGVDVWAEWRGPQPKGLAGEEIPAEARVVALADVYDALISPRVYKEPWPEEQVLELIRAERGRHFDPQVVDAFFDVYDLIQLVRARFPG